jgi:anti-anti-sigma factor
MGASPSEFEVTHTEVDGLAGVAVAGELDADTCGELASSLRRALRRDEPVVLDLDECTFIDLEAVDGIAEAIRRPKNGDGELVICNPSRYVAMVLNITGLDGMPGVRHGYRDGAPIGRDGAIGRARVPLVGGCPYLRAPRLQSGPR